MQFDSKRASQGLLIIGGLFVAIIMAISVTTNAAGGLAALVPLITVILAVLCFTRPNTGLYALVPLVIWVDEFKRLAVYFGGADSMTVYQTLAMPFVVLAALNCGFLLHALFGRVKLDFLCITFYALAGVVGCGIFVTMDGSLAERAQRAANLAGYITLIPIAYTYLKTFDEWRRFFALQVIFALPSAAWAIKQYYFGFNQIEWDYARSGLSATHFAQMFFFENPRVFGFFGSASALGCCAIYCAFAWWHGLRYSAKRFFWIFAALILSWTLVVSTQRTIMLYPIVVFVAAWFFRSSFRVTAGYIAAVSIFVTGIIYAEYLLDEGLDKINDAIAVESEWGREVLTVNTYSDRLRGWSRLGKAESWSLMGTGEALVGGAAAAVDIGGEDYNHDIINKILIKAGVVGLLAVMIPGGFILWQLHRIPIKTPLLQDRKDAAFALALALPMVGLSLIGGDNFNANPINMQIWTSFSGVIVCRAQMVSHRRRAFTPAARGPAHQGLPTTST